MIYIATHKKFDVPQLKKYCPIQVGAMKNHDLGYMRDDEGENISIKNTNYCELTGVYWIWKNCEDQYKGLVHYRRYFGRYNIKKRKKIIYSYDELVQLIQEGNDIILPKKEYFLQSAKEEIMMLCCTPDIFDNLRKCIKEIYPEYINEFDAFFAENQCSLFNMMFCKAKYFDEYCEWLFSILFELEKKVNLEKLNNYQKRIFGFLSERLLNVWVIHNHLTVKYINVINMEMTKKERFILCRRRFTNRLRFNISNNIYRLMHITK